jgi:hypothetical protein
MVLPIGEVLSVANILKQAWDLYSACKAAAGEFKKISQQVYCMIIVLDAIDADLIQNKRSVIHQKTDLAQTKLVRFKTLCTSCQSLLKRLKELLAEYRGSTVRWATRGKKDALELQADIAMSVMLLNTLMAKEGLDVLQRIENTINRMEEVIQALAKVNLVQPKATLGKRKRGHEFSQKVTLIASLFVGRLKSRLKSKRRAAARSRRPVLSKRPLANRNNLMSSPTKHGLERRKTLSTAYLNMALTDSLVDGNAGHLKRSPTLETLIEIQRMPGRAKAPSSKNPAEYLECWRVRKASTPFSPGVHNATRQRRGQSQLKEIASLFRDARLNDHRALTSRDSQAKYLLRLKRHAEKSRQYRWEFVAGRTECQEVSGIIISGQAMVIVRRCRK